MRYFAQIDELTGIANRHHFAKLSISAIELCQKSDQPVSFVIFDLDYFKELTIVMVIWWVMKHLKWQSMLQN